MSEPNIESNQFVYVAVGTPRRDWTRGMVFNSSEDDYPAVIPTTTEPVSVDVSGKTANLGVIACRGNFTELQFFGADTANDDFACKIYLWSKTGFIEGITTVHALPLWKPQFVCELDCTLSSIVGIADSPIVVADKIVDTITEIGTTTNRLSLIFRWSPADDATAAFVTIDTRGFRKLQVSFDISGGDGTAGTEANFEYRQY